MRNNLSFFILLFLCGGGTLFAHHGEETNKPAKISQDFSFWGAVEFSSKISPKIRFDLSQELRLQENTSQFGSTFTDAGLLYIFHDHIRAGIHYRMIRAPAILAHRGYVDLQFRYDLNKLSFSFRSRYQKEYENIFTSNNGKISDDYFRNKINVAYEGKKKIIPFSAFELYYLLRGVQTRYLFDRFRIYFGNEFRINNNSSLKVFYLLQRDINVNNPGQNNILGMSWNYGFSFNRKKIEE